MFSNRSSRTEHNGAITPHYHFSTRGLVYVSSSNPRENTFSSSELQPAPRAPGAAGTWEILPVACPGAAAPQVALLGRGARSTPGSQRHLPGALPACTQLLATGSKESQRPGLL